MNGEKNGLWALAMSGLHPFDLTQHVGTKQFGGATKITSLPNAGSSPVALIGCEKGRKGGLDRLIPFMDRAVHGSLR